MHMQMTIERFEHELMKIKNSVPPDYRHGGGWGDGNHRPCIINQLFQNTGVWNNGVYTPDNWYKEQLLKCQDRSVKLTERRIQNRIRLAMHMNDFGRTWHEIVDHILAVGERVRQQKEAKANATEIKVEAVETAELVGA